MAKNQFFLMRYANIQIQIQVNLLPTRQCQMFVDFTLDDICRPNVSLFSDKNEEERRKYFSLRFPNYISQQH